MAIICGLLSLFLLSAQSACNSPEEHEHGQEQASTTTYTCPMHPQIVEQEPGSCPICGMELVPVKGGAGDTVEVSSDLNVLLEPANYTVVSDIRTVQPVEDRKSVESSFPGVIAYDTRHTYAVPIRFGGRIEELNIRYNFQPVKKGQKLLEIYSPELLTAQRELLFLLESDSGNTRLLEAAKQKLRLMGLSEAQLEQLARSRKEQFSFPIYSPHTGYVYEAGQAPPTASTGGVAGGGMAGGMGASGGGGGMEGGGASGATGTAVGTAAGLSIREGMYVQKGQALFKVIDASQLWAEFNISAAEARLIREKDSIEISWGPGEQQRFKAQVDHILPFYAEGENFSKIRVYLEDPSLRVGQLVAGNILSQTPQTLWVPALAVLDAGTRKFVFVKQEGILRPREVVTGIRDGDQVEVVKGLSPQDAIAHNAQFLIDSEGVVKFGNEGI